MISLRAPGRFRGALLTDPASLAVFARASGPYRIPPLAVARPVDAGDVAALLEDYPDPSIPLIPRGAGTGMPAGNVGPGIVLDLTTAPLAGIGPVDREARSVRVGPGAVAAAVESRAAEAGLTLPPLPSSADRCTIGGMVAAGAAGARSFLHGSIREWVLGLELVLADGSIHRVGPGGSLPPLDRLPPGLDPPTDPDGLPSGWPRVRKNSSGYALDRFLRGRDPLQLVVGSEGTLGIITEVTLRLAPRPPSRALLAWGLPEVGLLSAAAAAADAAGASACEFLGGRLLEMIAAGGGEVPWGGAPPAALLLLEFEGEAAQVEEAMSVMARELGPWVGRPIEARSPEAREELWAIRRRASPMIQALAARGLRSLQVIEDSVVPPPLLPDYLEGVDALVKASGLDYVAFGHAGDGNAHVNLLADPGDPAQRRAVAAVLDGTARLVADLGGTLAGEHGDGRLRAPLLERIWAPHLVAAFRRVRQAFDPEGFLNPGVILPLPGQEPLAALWTGAGPEA